jgi:hypothetical protein
MIQVAAIDGFLHRHQRLLLALLIIAGVAIRVVWLVSKPQFPVVGEIIGETQNAAIAFSRTGVIGDAFAPGQGPTAHVMPITPAIAGYVYRWFGIDTPASIGILTTWTMFLVFGGYLLFYRAFARLGTPVSVRLATFAFLCLYPLNRGLEAATFRVWEGAMAVFMGAFFLDQLLRLDRAAIIARRDMIGLGLLAAACFFVSPPTGLAAYAGGLLLMVRKTEPRRWPGVIGIVAVTAAIVLTPWLDRNINEMGRPILLRDNFGLELAQAFYPEAATTTDDKRTFLDRHRSMHPFGDHLGNAYAKMQAAGGEAAYAEKLGAEAKAWMAANPGASAKLAAQHLTEMLFPPDWYWGMYFHGKPQNSLAKLAPHWAISALALAGIAYGLRQVGARYAYVAFFALLPLLPYILVQPTLRYRYLVITLFTYIAADFLWRLWARRARPLDLE